MNWSASKLGDLISGRQATSHIPDGALIYAVGDIHGRADLLSRLLDSIAEDLAREQEVVTLIFLGDYIDRGHDSRLVLEMLSKLKQASGERMVALKGNHEQALLDFLRGASTGAAWCDHGGRETLRSYGVAAPKRDDDLDGWAEARSAFTKALPMAHMHFLKSLILSEVFGDYLFVHAGVRPGVPLLEQEEEDLLWIRSEFLRETHGLDKVVVHGHTPSAAPSIAPGRIGIDTGAYATGVLTALKLKGDHRTYLHT